jgi:tryptophan-rich sensory protein
MNEPSTYAEFIKPAWAPPSWLFGPVWSVLYLIITISFGTVFYKAYTNEIPRFIVLPFALNLLFNFLFTPLQFGLKNNYLASLDVVLVVVTLVWALALVWIHVPHLRWVMYVNIPYLAWGLFATCLQFSINYLNR